MRRAHGPLLVVALAATTAFAGLVACSDDRERLPVTEDGDSGSEAGVDSNAPPSKEDGGADSSFDAASEPVSCTVTPCVVELAAGANHFCARMEDGVVRCWGDNEVGSVGNGRPKADAGDEDAGEPGDTSRPVTVTDLGRVTQISVAGRTSCARRDDGAVYCWGSNARGQLGLEVTPASADEEPHPYARPVALGGGAARIDVGQKSACAVLVSGGLSCWGSNETRQLTRMESEPVLGPGAADLAGFVVQRSAASETSAYGLVANGDLLSWGALSAREGSLDPDPAPAPIPTLRDVHDLSVGAAHACAIAGGSVYCWGSALRGALGTGLPSDQRFPAHAAVQTTAYPQQISVSRTTTCVRMTDGTVQCCGDATLGQLAITPPDGGAGVFAFVRAEKFVGYAVQVVTADTTTCALLRSGAVECWGGNEHGELGQGTRDTDPHPIPAPVSFP